MANEVDTHSWGAYKLLFHTNWYDWEISGICARNGKRYMFSMCDGGYDNDGDEWRIFHIYDPPAEVWVGIDAMREKFERMVGTHCSHDIGGCGMVNPNKEEIDRYFKEQEPHGEGPDVMDEKWLVAMADSRIPAPSHPHE